MHACRLDRDIFIIDQHAADEKFNFERLQVGLQGMVAQAQKEVDSSKVG